MLDVTSILNVLVFFFKPGISSLKWKRLFFRERLLLLLFFLVLKGSFDFFHFLYTLVNYYGTALIVVPCFALIGRYMLAAKH